jgi:methionine gamma-lyase
VQIPKTNRRRGFATTAIHHGYDPLDYQGALVPPVFLTSTFAFPTTDVGSDRFAGGQAGYIYTRVGNPTVSVLEARIAALEEGEAGLATASGMGAITAVLYTLLKAGDEIIADKTLYGCTFSLLKHGLTKFGVSTRFVDLTDALNLEQALSDRTRVVFFETPANPNMRVIDIAAIADIARRRRDIHVIVDNTYATPCLQRPLGLGADIVVHSATKYLAGHGDVLAGLVVSSRELIDRFRFEGVKEFNGASISPFDAFLVTRGLKTLELRMERHCATAAEVAEAIAAHRFVERLYYPGRPGAIDHDVAKRQMRRFGGMIAFELRGGAAAGCAFMDRLELVTRAVSLGDPETLVQHPASMTHSTYAPEERLAHGISDGLVRLSIGLEDADDILRDITAALDAVGAS